VSGERAVYYIVVNGKQYLLDDLVGDVPQEVREAMLDTQCIYNATGPHVLINPRVRDLIGDTSKEGDDDQRKDGPVSADGADRDAEKEKP
jgi:hypothetical protein